MKATKSNAVSKTVAVVGQLSLFSTVIPTVTPRLTSLVITGEHRNDEGELTSQSMRLMPISAKEGPSLKKLHPNATTEELKSMRDGNSQELKEWLVLAAGKLATDKNVGGMGIQASRSGRIALVFKKRPEQHLLVTDEEVAKAMGQSVEWVRKHRKAGGTLTIEDGKTLKPTPANGTPELVPSRKRSSRRKPAPQPATQPEPQPAAQPATPPAGQ